MNRMSHEDRLDKLLETVFNTPSDTPVPFGFSGRVMAHIADSQPGTVFSRMLWAVARPLLISGWAMAALLAFMAASGAGRSAGQGVEWLVSGGSLLNYFTL